MKYDYLIVGSGLYGSMFAYKAKLAGKKVLVVERRNHTGGNLYCKNIEGINIHMYGPHIFHTSNKKVWDFVNSITEFTPYTYSPLAVYNGKNYNLPFNMNTFQQLWGISKPEEAQNIISNQIRKFGVEQPSNLEEQAISMVGIDLYEKIIKGYTEKQWGRSAKELPSFIIKRLPVRFTFDNNYFNDTYQGIPTNGYNPFIEKLLEDVEVKLNTDFLRNKTYFNSITDKIIYTGCIDEYFDSYYGKLEYRGLSFEHQNLKISNYQGTATTNHTDKLNKYTRIIEHKHFYKITTENTVITKEYPITPTDYNDAYYPVNDNKNNELYLTYLKLASKFPKTSFGGRLGEYTYYNMDQIIDKALNMDLP